MEVVKKYPPNISKIRKVLNPPKTACFAYGSTIYNPSGNTIFEDMMVHEQVHEKQMKVIGPEKWWEMYLSDPSFRCDQEVEAYATQYNFVRQNRPSSMATRYLELFAYQLTSLYDINLTHSQAFTKIRLKAKELA